MSSSARAPKCSDEPRLPRGAVFQKRAIPLPRPGTTGFFRNRRLLVSLIPVLFLAFGRVALAGGFLLVDGSGEPYRWDPSRSIHYKIDRGGLNSSIDEAHSVSLIESVLEGWQNVSTAQISFQFDGLLDVDVTSANANAFLRDDADGLTPIVMDRDGAITELLLGAGSSINVLGFAGPRVIDQKTHRILEGQAIINGAARTSEAILRVVLLHEFGHLIGLDHTQAGIEFTGLQRDNFVFGARSYIPTMFPIIYTGQSQAPQDDDMLWISALYPKGTAGLAEISGTILRASGDFFPGANVVLRAADYNPSAGRVKIYSVVSDYLLQSNGAFRFPGVPPGIYELFIEPLYSGFTDGSGVGPFDSRFSTFPRDFYNGTGESGDPDRDDPTQRVLLQVQAGGVIQNLRVVSNEIPNNLATLADDDSVQYIFPNGFRFPFYNRTWDSAFVNSDGNLTFGRGEGSSLSRDLERFISGPPRIGGLFTDLNPEKGGEVLFTQRDNSVTFTWINVPEFSDHTILAAGDGNQFSITLFSNGDVEFHYGRLNVTGDDALSPVAVVGLSPGGGTRPSLVHLSANSSYAYGSSGIAEVFTSALDLTNRKILFRSGEASAASGRTLVVPLLQSGKSSFTSLAASNVGTGPATLNLTAYGASGDRLFSSEQILGGNSQSARLMQEWFPSSGGETPPGWVLVKSDSGRVSAFYQLGDNGLRWLDGATAVSEFSTHLYVSRVSEGAASFQGKDAQTWLSIVNPNNVPVRVGLSLHDPSGSRRSIQDIRIPAYGVTTGRLTTLFPDAIFPQSEGYVSMQSTGAGIAAFAWVRAGDTTVGLPALAPSLAETYYSAQFAHGKASDGALFTSLSVINTSVIPTKLTIAAFDENHRRIGAVYSRQLSGLQSVQLSAPVLFGLGEATSVASIVGSIELSSASGGIVAHIVFGDASPQVKFAASLPMQWELATEAYLSHVANGRLVPGDPASGYFTGIALYNPNTVAAVVSLDVTSPATGQVKTSGPIALASGQRFARSLGELVGSLGVQTGGYITFRSDVGVILHELLGNETLDFLSAVPADVFRAAEVR